MAKFVFLLNKSDHEISACFDVNVYTIPVGYAMSIPEYQAEAIAKHDTYKDHVIIKRESEDRNYMVKWSEIEQGREEAEEESSKLFDPTECSNEDIEAYADKNNLIIDNDANEDAVREIVIEHHMSNN